MFLSETPHHVLSLCVVISKKFPRLLAEREIIANAFFTNKVMQAPPLRLFPHSRTKVRLSEQNTKQKGKFFHFYLYFRAKVPSTDKSKVKNFQQYKKSEVFFKFKVDS